MWRSFCRFAVLLGLLGTAAGCGGGESGPRGSGGGSGPGTNVDPTVRPTLRTVLYLPSWRGSLATYRLAFENVSYVNLSFAEIDESGGIRYPDGGLPAFVQLAHQAGAKVCVALGGATTIENGGVFTTLLQDAQRPAFIDKLVTFAKDNQLDCLDVDLEGENGVGQHYEAFVTELAPRLKADNRELTAAVAGWFADSITNKAMLSFDFINVMAYDLYSIRNKPMQWSGIDDATDEVQRWVDRGMPKERVVYGVPFYGMQWPTAGGEPKTVGYGDLLRADPAAATSDELSSNGTVTYLNSRATIQAKAKLAQAYGGIMAWEASQDAAGDASLLQAIHDAVP